MRPDGSPAQQRTDRLRTDSFAIPNNEEISHRFVRSSSLFSLLFISPFSDEGLVVPAINLQLRNELFFSSESVGYSLERRIESMGRCTSDMCLHLLGGTQRLLVKNRHQHPTIVVLATTNDYSGVYAISAARILATKNIRIHLYLSPNSTRENSLFENEFKLLRTTQAIVTNQVNGKSLFADSATH